MAGRRVGVFDEEESGVDLSGFAPRVRGERPVSAREEVRAVSEHAAFRSRDPATVPMRAQRRHRTGRNRQINIKASQETVDRLYAIADANGWVLGEVLEHALEALDNARQHIDEGGHQK